MQTKDELIVELVAMGRLCVDAVRGIVYAPKSNTKDDPCGSKTSKGYLRVCINLNGAQIHLLAHRVIWVSAHGPIDSGMQVDHINMIKTDNRLENLEVVTGAENMKRAAQNGCFRNVGRRDGIRDEKGRFGKKLDGREWSEFPK